MSQTQQVKFSVETKHTCKWVISIYAKQIKISIIFMRLISRLELTILKTTVVLSWYGLDVLWMCNRNTIPLCWKQNRCHQSLPLYLWAHIHAYLMQHHNAFKVSQGEVSWPKTLRLSNMYMSVCWRLLSSSRTPTPSIFMGL